MGLGGVFLYKKLYIFKQFHFKFNFVSLKNLIKLNWRQIRLDAEIVREIGQRKLIIMTVKQHVIASSVQLFFDY